MGTKILDRKNAKAGRAYAADLYGWVEDQMALLKAGDVSSIDAFHVTRELEDLGRSEFNKLVSALRVVLLHLLKWDHQPERRSRSWVSSIRVQRGRIIRELKSSPSLKPRILEAISVSYIEAVDAASDETGLPPEAFPENCPYRWEDITVRVIRLDENSISERR